MSSPYIETFRTSMAPIPRTGPVHHILVVMALYLAYRPYMFSDFSGTCYKYSQEVIPARMDSYVQLGTPQLTHISDISGSGCLPSYTVSTAHFQLGNHTHFTLCSPARVIVHHFSGVIMDDFKLLDANISEINNCSDKFFSFVREWRAMLLSSSRELDDCCANMKCFNPHFHIGFYSFLTHTHANPLYPFFAQLLFGQVFHSINSSSQGFHTLHVTYFFVLPKQEVTAHFRTCFLRLPYQPVYLGTMIVVINILQQFQKLETCLKKGSCMFCLSAYRLCIARLLKAFTSSITYIKIEGYLFSCTAAPLSIYFSGLRFQVVICLFLQLFLACFKKDFRMFCLPACRNCTAGLFMFLTLTNWAEFHVFRCTARPLLIHFPRHSLRVIHIFWHGDVCIDPHVALHFNSYRVSACFYTVKGLHVSKFPVLYFKQFLSNFSFKQNIANFQFFFWYYNINFCCRTTDELMESLLESAKLTIIKQLTSSTWPPAFRARLPAFSPRVCAPPSRPGFSPSGPSFLSSGPSFPPSGPGFPPSGPGASPSAPGFPPSGPGAPPSAPSFPPAAPGFPPLGPGAPPSALGFPPSAPSFPPAGPGPSPSGPGAPPSDALAEETRRLDALHEADDHFINFPVNSTLIFGWCDPFFFRECSACKLHCLFVLFYFSRPPSLFVQGCFLALCFCPLAVQVCVKLVRNDK